MWNPVLFAHPPFSDQVVGDLAVLPPITITSEHAPVILAPAWSDMPGATWYGGSFVATLPVSNLTTQELENVARTTDLALASTQARCAFGKVRSVNGCSVPRATCTMNAQYRVTYSLSDAGLDSDTPVYRSGWRRTWPLGLDPEDARAFSVPHYHVLDTPVQASHAKIEWRDSGNANGYLDISRAQFAAALIFSNGISVGAEVKINENSDVVLTDGNTTKKFKRPKWRSFPFTVDMQTELDAFLQSFRFQADVGMTDQFFFIFDQNDDPRLGWQRAFLGRLQATTGVKWSSSMYLATSLEIVEDL